MNRGRSKHAQARLHCSVRELGFCGYPSVSVLLLKLGSTIRGDFSALPCCRRFQTSATHDLRTKNSRAGGFDGTHKFARFPFILIQYDCPHKKTTRSKVYTSMYAHSNMHTTHTHAYACACFHHRQCRTCVCAWMYFCMFTRASYLMHFQRSFLRLTNSEEPVLDLLPLIYSYAIV